MEPSASRERAVPAIEGEWDWDLGPRLGLPFDPPVSLANPSEYQLPRMRIQHQWMPGGEVGMQEPWLDLGIYLGEGHAAQGLVASKSVVLLRVSATAGPPYHTDPYLGNAKAWVWRLVCPEDRLRRRGIHHYWPMA